MVEGDCTKNLEVKCWYHGIQIWHGGREEGSIGRVSRKGWSQPVVCIRTSMATAMNYCQGTSHHQACEKEKVCIKNKAVQGSS
jgi:hypothetical protein